MVTRAKTKSKAKTKAKTKTGAAAASAASAAQPAAVVKKWKEALASPATVEELELDVKQLPPVRYPATKPLPPEIGGFVNLKKLRIRAGNLAGFCPELGRLQRLEKLEIDNTETASFGFGAVLAELGALRELELYNMSLTGFVPLPASLEKLDLHSNARLDYEAWMHGLAGLPALRELALAEACPAGPPPSIASLPALRGLDLAQNGYTEVPAVVWSLERLHSLGLGVNKLTRLPEEIGRLRSLTRLSLGHNALTALPEALRGLTSLDTLLLAANPLDGLPDWFSELQALRVLDLRAVALSDLPPAFSFPRLESLWIDVPDAVLAELTRRMPSCKIVRRTAQDEQRDLERWLKFFDKKHH